MHPLLHSVLQGHTGVDALGTALRLAGGPLRTDRGDDSVALTFVWLGDAPAVSLQCGLVPGGASIELDRLGDLPVWSAELVAPRDTLVSYRLVIDDPFLGAHDLDDDGWQRLMLVAQQRSFADPHNPERIAPLAVLFGLPVPPEQYESVLALDHAPSAPWFQPHDAPPGSLHRFEHTSAALGDRRAITVWTPPVPATEHPLVLLLDGTSFLQLAELPHALDLAVARGDMRPPIVAFVHEAEGSAGLADRTRELSCNPAHASMLVDELLPELRRRFPVSTEPADTVLGGASLGGLASAFTATGRPDVVGNVLSVSGSFWFGLERDGRDQWLTRQLQIEPVRGLRWYQQIGRLEDGPLAVAPDVTHLQANRNLHELLVTQGVDVTYDELGTAHDVCAFRVAVLRGLCALLPR